MASDATKQTINQSLIDLKAEVADRTKSIITGIKIPELENTQIISNTDQLIIETGDGTKRTTMRAFGDFVGTGLATPKEVQDARGGYPQLGDRLDDMDGKIGTNEQNIQNNAQGIQNNSQEIAELKAKHEADMQEVINAREDAQTPGTVHDNLKQRLDSDYNYLNSEIEKTNTQLSVIKNEISNVLNIYSPSVNLSDKTSLNSISSTTFENSLVNFDNKLLTLTNELTLTFNNCIVTDLNVDLKEYNSLKITGNNYHLINININGENANLDYFNKTDVGSPLFIALTLSGNNFSFSFSKIENVVSRQALMVKNANHFEIKHNKIIDCYSYNRINHSSNGGGFDNYGDGIYISDSTDGEVKYNKVQNSMTNPVGRCGIVSEFNTRNINIKSNEICGYDRGVHIELCDDLITVENNTIYGCNIPLMCWNVKKANVKFIRNKCTNKGLDKNYSLHNPIVTYGIAIISCLGNYDVTNGMNVIFIENELHCDINAKYRDYCYIENALPVRFIGNTFKRDENSYTPRFMTNGDNVNSKIHHGFLSDNYIDGTLTLLYLDKYEITNNYIFNINYFDKTSTTITNFNNRKFTFNTVDSTVSNGGVALQIADSIVSNNTFNNLKGDYVISKIGNKKIFSGNTFIRNNSGNGILDLNLIKTSSRYVIGGIHNNIIGTSNNLFIDFISNVDFSVKPNGEII